MHGHCTAVLQTCRSPDNREFAILIMLPFLALMISLAALVASGIVTTLEDEQFRRWVPLAMYAAPLAMTLAAMALWGLRHNDRNDLAVRVQRRQAGISIALSLIAVVWIYVYIARVVDG